MLSTARKKNGGGHTGEQTDKMAIQGRTDSPQKRNNINCTKKRRISHKVIVISFMVCRTVSVTPQ